MNHNISIICPLFETSSGKVYLAEEMVQNNSILKYFAFEFRKDYVEKGYFFDEVQIIKNTKKPRQFRNYQKMYKNQLFLFNYIEGEFFDKIILVNVKLQKSFENTEIKIYLKQLLEALYELHSNKIPGRLFSVQNILQTQTSKRMILMDFGFGSRINQDQLDILAPPEYLESLIEKNNNLLYNSYENDKVFDLKFDSWLVGAFLYNLIKLRPINHIKSQQNTFERYKYDEKEQYLQHLKKMKFIPCQTSRYNQNLCSFVQDLLTYNKEKRLSFFQIYQHEYIQNLQIEEQNKYLKFYKNLSTILDQKFKPDYQSVIMKQLKFENKKFDTFWLQKQLDYFKCFILEETEEKIINLLPRYIHPYEYIFAYFVKKMHLLILRETNHYSQSDQYQNKLDQDCQIFLQQFSKDLLKSIEIFEYIDKLTKQLIEMFRQHCYIHLNKNSKLSQNIKKSILDDYNQNHSMLLNSQEFFENGYFEALEILFQYINQLKVQDEISEELQQFQKQIYICIIITSLDVENFQQIFREVLPENQQIKPSDILINFGFVGHNC
ncbi:unnamed protein product [Paramecium sonneborni]|uniref:Protein kinase domain-containing protein n=1 Tax=Paramecium sonneborni TaxID=65129 RepID=A0A8S1RF72_9CILI|nr:unnamed protein product [Paramecium sonneborni]